MLIWRDGVYLDSVWDFLCLPCIVTRARSARQHRWEMLLFFPHHFNLPAKRTITRRAVHSVQKSWPQVSTVLPPPPAVLALSFYRATGFDISTSGQLSWKCSCPMPGIYILPTLFFVWYVPRRTVSLVQYLGFSADA